MRNASTSWVSSTLNFEVSKLGFPVTGILLKNSGNLTNSGGNEYLPIFELLFSPIKSFSLKICRHLQLCMQARIRGPVCAGLANGQLRPALLVTDGERRQCVERIAQQSPEQELSHETWSRLSGLFAGLLQQPGRMFDPAERREAVQVQR